MTKDDLFLFKLGHSVSTREDPQVRLMVAERLFVEFLDKDKPRRVMYACRDNTNGSTNLIPQQRLIKWDGTQKTLPEHKICRSDETKRPIPRTSKILL
jgi:hypothetical protein